MGFCDAWGGVDDNMVKPVGSGAIEGLRDKMLVMPSGSGVNNGLLEEISRGKKNQVNSCRGAVRLYKAVEDTGGL